ncbi:hypothetical protein Dred_0816 [Desulforamulus reducens MI-1]|uniref:Uncharacterized protein n=1 Tax=Desulforamulus reducens (strain ATCC BAA-1160 / DSM 100696 / MI-1) TaxID=349161 RepID=A4J2Q1_DESRM|nr:hypothetical protein [Desulforamulus reducens]ABO49354.1 hypothetical protein Dred_0816 [Desulforamulus reducens MI-1]
MGGKKETITMGLVMLIIFVIIISIFYAMVSFAHGSLEKEQAKKENLRATYQKSGMKQVTLVDSDSGNHVFVHEPGTVVDIVSEYKITQKNKDTVKKAGITVSTIDGKIAAAEIIGKGYFLEVTDYFYGKSDDYKLNIFTDKKTYQQIIERGLRGEKVYCTKHVTPRD